jgi:hypothetical protein
MKQPISVHALEVESSSRRRLKAGEQRPYRSEAGRERLDRTCKQEEATSHERVEDDAPAITGGRPGVPGQNFFGHSEGLEDKRKKVREKKGETHYFFSYIVLDRYVM